MFDRYNIRGSSLPVRKQDVTVISGGVMVKIHINEPNVITTNGNKVIKTDPDTIRRAVEIVRKNKEQTDAIENP